jgi:4-amino-4-deoxy-L-arabinose transferase-like glycosyltransferase
VTVTSLAAAPTAAWPVPARRRRRMPVVVALGVGILAAVLRMVRIRSSNDIFIDEVTYTRLAQSIADGHGVALAGQPFDLHPPAVLGLYGLVTAVLSPSGGLISLVFDLRYVAAAFGALACVGLYLLVRRATSELVATAAAVVLAIDPFAIHFDSRVLLEAPTQAAAVGAIGALAGAICAKSATSRRLLLGLAGLMASITLCSKETFGLVLALTLVALLVTGWTHARAAVAAVGAMAVTGYVISVVAEGAASGFSPWWTAQTSGIRRLVGTDQETGFNAPTTHVSLVSRVFANATDEATTYVILVTGVLAAAWILVGAWRRRATYEDRAAGDRIAILIAVWTIAGVVYLGYATLFGTIEEQMYYICLLPCVASLAVWVAPRLGAWRPAMKAIAVGALVAVLAFDATAWVRLHTTNDTDYVQLINWEATHLPAGSVVAATESTAQFLITHVVIGQWDTMAAFRASHVDYVIASTTLTTQGYALISPALLRQLQREAPVVFSATDATTGRLEVFDIRHLEGVRR